MAGYLVGKYSIYTDTMGLLKWMRITNPTQPSDLKGMTSGRNWRKPRKVPEHWSDPFSFENPRSSSLQSIPLRKLDAWKKQLQTIFSPSIDGFRMIYHARISVKNHNKKKQIQLEKEIHLPKPSLSGSMLIFGRVSPNL